MRRRTRFLCILRSERIPRSTSTATRGDVRNALPLLVTVERIMAVSQRLSPAQLQDDRAAVPRLIVPDAALALLSRWRTELAVLRRRSPTSDAVKTLADCIQELVDAITTGHQVTVRLTLVEARELSRIPLSTLRWLCNHKSDAVGACKQEGAWYLDRSKFEAYIGARTATTTPVQLPGESISLPRRKETVASRIADRELPRRVAQA